MSKKMRIDEVDLRKQGKLTWWNVAQYNNCVVIISEKQNQELRNDPITHHTFLRECHFRDIKIEIN